MALRTDLDQGVTNGRDEQQFGQQRRRTTSDAVTPDGRMVAASAASGNVCPGQDAAEWFVRLLMSYLSAWA
jgi:hypothetical protein